MVKKAIPDMRKAIIHKFQRHQEAKKILKIKSNKK